ncbi:MAG: sulfatase-like hydrolase/transferase [Planctomycetales bacterium]|nr:sulfatase-like hydrolase/transferase [Planctomycetales bacterium]
MNSIEPAAKQSQPHESGISRRFSLATVQVVLSGILLPLLVSHVALAAEAEQPRKPNVLFILADDLGWADIGYHDSGTSTPNIDRLAANGVKLEQHYVWPTCSPTRVALLTGREPSRFGVLTPLGDDGRIPADTVTLATALRSRGYTTHISGKWHIGAPPSFRPLLFGFDTSYGYFRGQIDPYTHRYKFGNRTWHRNDELLDEEGHATDLIADEAIRVIRSSVGKPFFLYVPFSVPHFPLSEPDEWTTMYDDKIDDSWRKLNAASIVSAQENHGGARGVTRSGVMDRR